MKITVIIPALNEAEAIVGVVGSIPNFVDRIIVVDNGSTDGTGDLARDAGADVVYVEKPGYGRSCLAGIAAGEGTDVFVLMDGDGADVPSLMSAILNPILNGDIDFVVGSRISGDVERGALTTTQRFGNTLACFLMRIIWRGSFTDLGPFRAISAKALDSLSMAAPTFGWTIEMQVRALKRGLTYAEVPVQYRRRIGVSKISGTVKGVISAGVFILGVIAREALFDRSSSRYLRNNEKSSDSTDSRFSVPENDSSP